MVITLSRTEKGSIRGTTTLMGVPLAAQSDSIVGALRNLAAMIQDHKMLEVEQITEWIKESQAK